MVEMQISPRRTLEGISPLLMVVRGADTRLTSPVEAIRVCRVQAVEVATFPGKPRLAATFVCVIIVAGRVGLCIELCDTLFDIAV
jgi:hypothetical protein